MATIKYKDENGQWQEIAIGGGEVIVDNKLSSISENPVQNKVIYAELIERFDGIDALLDAINGEEI